MGGEGRDESTNEGKMVGTRNYHRMGNSSVEEKKGG